MLPLACASVDACEILSVALDTELRRADSRLSSCHLLFTEIRDVLGHRGEVCVSAYDFAVSLGALNLLEQIANRQRAIQVSVHAVMKEPGVFIAQRRVAVVDNLDPVESVFFGRVE